MTEQDNVLNLKKLAVKVIGNITISDVKGETIADVLDYIQANYTGGGEGTTIQSVSLNANGEQLIKGGQIVLSNGSEIEITVDTIETLSVTSTEGTGLNKTIISVSPPLQAGNTYRYSLSTTVIPAYHEDLTGWEEWDGTSEIEATDGKVIIVVECTANGKALRSGKATVHAPIF